MDNKDYTTEHRKGEHLSSEERHEIEVRLKDQWTIYEICQASQAAVQHNQERNRKRYCAFV